MSKVWVPLRRELLSIKAPLRRKQLLKFPLSSKVLSSSSSLQQGHFQTKPWRNRASVSHHQPQSVSGKRGRREEQEVAASRTFLMPGIGTGGHWGPLDLGSPLPSRRKTSGCDAFWKLFTFWRMYVSLVFDSWKEGKSYGLLTTYCCPAHGVCPLNV